MIWLTWRIFIAAMATRVVPFWQVAGHWPRQSGVGNGFRRRRAGPSQAMLRAKTVFGSTFGPVFLLAVMAMPASGQLSHFANSPSRARASQKPESDSQISDWALGYSTYLGQPNSAISTSKVLAAAASESYYCLALAQNLLAKIDITNGSVLYSATLPKFLGNALPQPQVAVAIDSQGDCYVAGIGTITPTPGVFQSKLHNTADYGQFLMKFGPTGSVLYATYLASSEADAPSGLAVDSTGDAYLTGSTDATDFPTKNAYQPTFGGGSSDAYVAVLNTTATALIYSTYLGGSQQDSGTSIAVDSGGNAYVTGTTYSSNFPTVVPFQGALSGTSDAFVTKLNSSGVPSYSTYLSGSEGSQGSAIAVDTSGSAYVTGAAGSSDFPLANPIQSSWQQSAFVSELNSAGSALVYSTFWGSETAGSTIAVDSSGQTFFAGSIYETTGSVPLVSSIDSYVDPILGASFLSVLSSGGNSAVFSTYLYSSIPLTNVATDSAGDIFGVGNAFPNLPIVSAQNDVFLDPFSCQFPDTNCDESYESQTYVLKITQAPGPVLALPNSLAFNPTVVLMPSDTAQLTLANSSSSGTINVSNIAAAGDFSQTNNCPSALTAAATCALYVTFNPTAGGTRNGTVTITDDQPGSPQAVELSGTGLNGEDSLVPNPLIFSSQDVGTASSPQAVTLSNTSRGTGTFASADIPLIFTQISVSGSDFSEFANNCVSPLSSYGSSCEIHITFTPTAAGVRTGTVTIVDNAAGSPQTVPLSGIGVGANDFVIEPTPGSPTSQTLTAGKSATFNLGITAGASFSGAASLSCGITPVVTPAPTCTLSTSTVQLTGGGSQPVTMTVGTTAPITSGMIFSIDLLQRAMPLACMTAFFASGLFFLRKLKGRMSPATPLTVLAIAVLMGCGGGATSPSAHTTPGTPPGTYTATVTATSGSLQHSTALTVSVQ